MNETFEDGMHIADKETLQFIKEEPDAGFIGPESLIPVKFV